MVFRLYYLTILVTVTLLGLELIELIRWCYFIRTLCPNKSWLFLRGHWLMSLVTLYNEEDRGVIVTP